MNALACAPVGVNLKTDIFKFDFKKLEENVRRLQTRIVKAQQEGKYNKVKSLQWLLTHSLSAKILAVKRVTENKGKNTPGIDKVIWNTDKQKCEAVRRLKRTGYKAQPLRRVFIAKKNGKKRPLGIPTMTDRAIQALYLMALDPVAETVLDHDTYGFRKKRSTADAIEAVFKATFADKDCAEWVMEGDIKGCFDNISHEWLMENIPMDRRVLGQWLKAGIIWEGKYSDTETGAPQGGLSSPCIANLALNGLGSLLDKKYMTWRKNNKVHTIFYADDFIITGISKEFLEEEVLPEVKEFMRKRSLELSEEKTLITHIKKGFDFLGQNIRKYKGKVLIKPSKDNTKRFLNDIRGIIKRYPTIKQIDLIKMLNPKIRGWANYHRHIVAKETFSYVDFHIYQAINSWCQRRHPKKGRWWINNKYFHSVGNRHWVFAAESDKGELTELLRADATKIVRHVKIRKDANPYDRKWEMYFEEREGDLMFCSMNGKKQLKVLWVKQDKNCPVCGDEINKVSGWKVHTGDTGKKVLVHPECHKKYHSVPT